MTDAGESGAVELAAFADALASVPDGTPDHARAYFDMTHGQARALRAALKFSAAGDRQTEAVRQQIINSPETADFMAGVPIEAAHQRERWGAEHDAGKSPFDWFWLIGYLAQKAADAATRGDAEKAMHHTISTAAALANWHAALSGKSTAMRPGIEPPEHAVRAAQGNGDLSRALQAGTTLAALQQLQAQPSS